MGNTNYPATIRPTPTKYECESIVADFSAYPEGYRPPILTTGKEPKECKESKEEGCEDDEPGLDDGTSLLPSIHVSSSYSSSETVAPPHVEGPELNIPEEKTSNNTIQEVPETKVDWVPPVLDPPAEFPHITSKESPLLVWRVLDKCNESIYKKTSSSSSNPKITLPTDTVVKSVMEKFEQRSSLGMQKYGTTLDRTDLSTLDWINHVQEELMDAILYLERLKRDFVQIGNEQKTNHIST